MIGDMPSFELRKKVLGRAAFFMAAAVFAIQAPTGCTGNDVKDSGDAKPVFECSPDPVLFCNPLPVGTQGCTGAKESPDTYLQRLPADRAFGEGCVANFVRKDIKIEEVCGLSAVCTCVRVDENDAAVPPPPPPADAGADTAPQDAEAPDAETPDAETPDAEGPDAAPPGDATAPPADAAVPPKTGRLVWSCR